MSSTPASLGDNALAVNDLGPLAWVLDELRKSLDSATKAMRRFGREAELARGADQSDLDASSLRIARQQLHQVVGALDMVGLEAPAKVLRAMEALAQKFVQQPEVCSEDAAAKVERASFAVIEYLEGLLKGKTASPVALFPQYRAVLELVGAERVHPADLWPAEWRWIEVAAPSDAPVLEYSPALRRRLDTNVLKFVKTGDTRAARNLSDICLGLSGVGDALEPRTFWRIGAGYFESIAQGLCPYDVYSKRAASRFLQQYAALSRGLLGVSERLAQDLVFFCSLAAPSSASAAPLLHAVRVAYGLAKVPPVDYETEQFGRFDPAQLVLARKRIAAAAETWSALAGGDVNRLKAAAEQFASVTESMIKLHPESMDLARALTRVVDATVASASAPRPAVAMEVATTILYLESAYEDLDPTQSQLVERGARLVHRLGHVGAGGDPEPMEGWMEDLYRRVSDRQTMGSVVDELRAALDEVEKSLDQFFRAPHDKSPLRELPSQLAQMRGVFSVLGLDQPALAALRMRASVDQFLVDDIDEEHARTGVFEKLGNSLGAMGFLIDMLSYQRELAKKLFVYDEALGEFRPLMGRERVVAAQEHAQEAELSQPDADVSLDFAMELPVPEVPEAAAPAPAPVAMPEPAPVFVSAPAVAQPAAEQEDGDDGELIDIFLEEAREVVQNGLTAVDCLVVDPADLSQQTILRRAFHTLKGSSRMVGLQEFGEAAWSFEQLLNTVLAEQRPVSDDLILVARDGLMAFDRWVNDIANHADVPWNAQDFRRTSDALRLDNQLVSLHTPGDVLPVQEQAAAPEVAPVEEVLDAPLLPELDAMPALQVDELPQEPLPALEPEVELSAPELPVLEVAEPELPVVELQDIETLEFSLPELEQPASDAPTELASLMAETELAPLHSEAEAPAAAEPEVDESVKVIGSIRLSIPLYNVYLNEADEWSRRLQTELNEWALELHEPLPDSAVVLAHSLAGSSATVGFAALSDMAHALEAALQHVQLHRQGTSAHAEVFVHAAEEVRRLLHQFAAGFVKEANPSILDELQAIIDTQFAAPTVETDAAPLEVEVAYEEQDFASEEAPAPVDIVSPVGAVAAPMVAAPLTVADAHDEDLDAVDSLDEDLFPIFEEEAAELMPQLGAALREWVAQPASGDCRSEVLRVLHTLKGSARLAGAMRLGEMAHRLESSVEQLGVENLQAAQIEPLLTRFDSMQETLTLLGQPAQEEEDVAEAATPVVEAQDASATPALASKPIPIHAPAAAVAAPVRASGNQTVRVRSKLLDRLVNQAGEVLVTRSRMDARLTQVRESLNELGGNLDRLRQQLRDVEVQAESQMQSRLAQTRDSAQAFDPLEFDRFTRVQELTRMMAESVHDVATVQRNLQRSVEGTEDDLIAQGRQARELQRDLLRTRMVEFDSISDRLYGVVRQAAKDTGKPVKLDIAGGSIEMDRGVLERMAPAFEHMLRNAVAHGVEDAQTRAQAGKPAIGTITITVSQESNDISVAFSDDGGGLHVDKIRAKAIANGLITADEELSEAAAANLIFTPGFSTAEQVTELAGRGIGMDVVQTEVVALGGRIETSSVVGQHTTFRLVLPLTTAITQVVMLRMGEFTVGVPTNLIETVLRVPNTVVDQAYASESFAFAGEDLPFYWAGALLQVSARSSEPPLKTHALVVLRSAGQRVVLHVDEILGNREVVVKNLGPQLARLPGLTGMSVLASGSVVLIYNPVVLATVYGEQARLASVAPAPAQADTPAADQAGNSSAWSSSVTQAPLILVVDDSITVRRVTQRLLKREGYRVALASDGLDALEKLLEEKPTVVLSDIEMPRMDGFDLARNIRGDERLKDLPIIMITSRIAQKHREHAKELGVDHYLGKPYSEEELLGLVRGYCPVVAA